ncbi:MAG: gliding motility-associated C-terminal domain-containing protein, partial [Endomicrobiia bacterium]|nr:gliding motility-associated C-terminal domain-containing protein [Endomicrobiia bacterium]
DGAVIETQTPLFEWQASADSDPDDAVVYILRYSLNDPDFSSPTEVSGISSTQYQIPPGSALHPDATYYWRVIARDLTARQSVSADWKFYIRPSARPLAPSAFDASYDTAARQVLLSWTAPALNTDGTPVGVISHYLIYKSHDYDELHKIAPTTFVASSEISFIASSILPGTYFMIRAVNSLGVTGEISKVLRADNVISVLWRDASGEIRVKGDKEQLPPTVTLYITDEDSPSDDPKARRSFIVTARGTQGGEIKAFGSPVILSVKLSADSQRAQTHSAPAVGSRLVSVPASSGEAIYWFNGVEWISLGGSVENGYLVTKIASPGSFRVRAVERASVFRILNVWPKVITPNVDGVNDEFNVTFENPLSEKAEGDIFDITGFKISKMTAKTDSWSVWDGKSESGASVPVGIYVYHLKVGSSVKNGTVVVAR